MLRPPSSTPLSLHDALPISSGADEEQGHRPGGDAHQREVAAAGVLLQEPRRQRQNEHRSEEHTSELQSRRELVCRLLLEKKKGKKAKSQEEAEQSKCF